MDVDAILERVAWHYYIGHPRHTNKGVRVVEVLQFGVTYDVSTDKIDCVKTETLPTLVVSITCNECGEEL